MHPAAVLLAVPLLAAAATAQRPGEGALPRVTAGSTQLSSSAITFYDCEYVPHYGQPTSHCDQLLTSAKKGGSSR